MHSTGPPMRRSTASRDAVRLGRNLSAVVKPMKHRHTLALISTDDTAIRIDEISQGQSEYAAEELPELCISHRDGIVQAVLLVHALDRRRNIVHGYAHDLQAGRSVSILPSGECGDLDQARPAPRGPEIQQHDLAPILA